MKKLLQEIDFHLIVLGGIIGSLILLAISVVTIVPGTPQLISVIWKSMIPFLILLEPMVITGTFDRLKLHDGPWLYFFTNTGVVILIGVVVGICVFSILPRTQSLRTTDAEQGGEADDPPLIKFVVDFSGVGN